MNQILMRQCLRKMATGRRVADAIRSLVNARDLQLQCARILHEILFVPVLKFGSETMLWKEERFRIRAVQMDNLRGLLGIKRMDSFKCTDKGVVCAGSCSMGRRWKRRIDTVKECLRKKGLDIRQARRVHNRSE